jgi:hypothetical protein
VAPSGVSVAKAPQEPVYPGSGAACLTFDCEFMHPCGIPELSGAVKMRKAENVKRRRSVKREGEQT